MSRIEKAYKILIAAFQHAKPAHEGNIGSPRNLGKGQSIQLSKRGSATYVTQGRYTAYFPSIEKVKAEPSRLKRALAELKQNPLGVLETPEEEPYRGDYNSVFVTLDESAKLARPKNPDDFIRTLVQLISEQVKDGKTNEVIIPKGFVPEFTHLVCEGSGIAKELNDTDKLDTLATAIKDSLFNEDIPVVDIDEIKTVGVHSDYQDNPAALEENKKSLEELKNVLGEKLFNLIAHRYQNPHGAVVAHTGKAHYKLLSALLDLRKDFKPSSFYESQKLFVGHPHLMCKKNNSGV